ncbi:MAG: RidA family protein [Planctomycetales bacterium]|nr:RidA family protein [Planctomycetales bacterium]
MISNSSRITLPVCLCLTFYVFWQLAGSLYAANREVQVDDASGVATAVVVDDLALAHTTQLLPFDKQGRIASGRLDRQIAQLATNLAEALEAVGTNVTQIARLNVYLSPKVEPTDAEKLLLKHLFRQVHPAVTYVVTPLPRADALIGVDAIASVAESADSQVGLATDSPLATWLETPLASVLPRGRVVYISGMAENSDDLAAATAGTMKQLQGVLELLGIETKQVVHVKSFLKPMAEVATARKAIRQSFPAESMPPLSFVEWTNGLPIEIEMIAFLPGRAEPNGTVQLRWQPDEKRSPVYCRFAVVDSPTRVYVSGLRSREITNPEGQVRDIFAQLDGVLETTGSDMRQLAKATYYVADDEVSKALNDIRPEIYDPERPPAASKASIAGTGLAGRTITIDMIAVPGK